MIDIVSLWSHSLAAILFGALALWELRRSLTDVRSRMLIFAALATACWALTVAIRGPEASGAQLIEHVRNIGWIGFMYALWRPAEGGSRVVTVGALYGVIAAVVVTDSSLMLVLGAVAGSPTLIEITLMSSIVLRMMTAVGALVLVHNLYTAATPEARESIRLPMIGLAALWTYDLNLYTISYLSRGWSHELFALRGLALTLVAPIFGLASLRTQNWNIRLSRTVAFQSLSLVAIGGYLSVMVIVTSALQFIGGDYARMVQVCFVFVSSVAALVLLPSSSFRAWFRVKVSKHLFQHRYDYRAEWLRFTDTLGRPGVEGMSLDTRVIQAVADITESPGGLLLIPDASGALVAHARWNWDAIDPPAYAAGTIASEYFRTSGRVVELDDIRRRADEDSDEVRCIPEWIMADPSTWAIAPLVHFDRLAGIVLLERPLINRTLDWEDFDLLRVVGRQVASYLAEARGQQALADVKRFDEFNRRFAFIMHDIKNLVSQLSLVTRNAERHADNPEFRADMIATLKSSTARMNDLLARLSQHNKGRAQEPEAINATEVITRVAATRRAVHPIVIGGHPLLHIIADAPRLEQALNHLVQNAIEASPVNEPVCINTNLRGDEVSIDVVDRGTGMSAGFIREKLFQPFTSTKDGGFGIGAFEARSLIIAMGGRIEVASRLGEGSQFSVILPFASEAQLHKFEPEALVA
ncbi:MAG: XrtA/PEP-CTERM system histidine kinase PrsK [Sphingomonadaceae bacterium]